MNQRQYSSAIWQMHTVHINTLMFQWMNKHNEWLEWWMNETRFALLKHINTGWMIRWEWREGVERNTNPSIWEYAERFYSISFCTSWERSYLEFCFQTQEKFAGIWLVLALKTFTPLGSNALLLHVKSSRRTFAIGINLERKTCFQKGSTSSILFE